MLNRYPHTATLTLTKEARRSDGITEPISQSFEINGRFEPAMQSGSTEIDYRAKYYCQNFEHLLIGLFTGNLFESGLFEGLTKEDLPPFRADGHHLEYAGKEFVVSMLHNYQVHCELWLT